MAFWIAGVPGKADMVKVDVPSAIAAGATSRRAGLAEELLRHGRENEKGDEKTDPAIGDEGAGENDGEDRAPRSELLSHEMSDGRHRAAIVHQFAEERAEQEDREELRDEARAAVHESDSPMSEQRLPCEGRRDQRRDRREQQHAPPAVGEADQNAERNENSE